ncbi:dehypoxanthine futalosine cyclase [Helicobacter felis]|uniref:Cyclic dehypoxanthine futalosine synthase n=1 Tax=Helicobacter felis (strain ATCC 49179 / CCUG 28539 / NCTC 12436 / CS1) TaxID=936155 RepID=E7AAE1_HELFC|nr:dehypoxanthine futalosine cyclase [Helicobacter felis]CBY82663.1 Radical SAM domain protein [Helicobacter felis ATCC 49179]
MQRLDRKILLEWMAHKPLKELGRMALAKKQQLHPENTTTFIVDRNINYTNICFVDCKFCAFKRTLKDKDAYLLSFEEIDTKIEELIAIGGTQILFQGGVHPQLKIDYYENLVSHIAQKFPTITIHGFSAVEIDYIAKISRLSLVEVLERLKAAGLSSIPGAGAEILSDRVRHVIAPKKLSADRWIEVHRQAHKCGIKSTATMMFGSVDTNEDVIEHLERVRNLQDETGGFRAFILWSFQPNFTPLQQERPDIKKASSNRYLRLLACSRLFLDNIANIQSSWVTQGAMIGQLALLFGANDLGSVMMEENVVKAAGTSFCMDKEEMVALVADLGGKAAKRNTAYEILERY